MFIVYKTSNLINGHFYIGSHNTSSVNSNKYLGGGKMIQAAIKEFGHKNFKRETLMEFDTREDALDYEHWLVNEYMINIHDCYNIGVGGCGGITPTDITKQLMKQNHSGMRGKLHSEKTRRRMSDSATGKAGTRTGYTASESTKQKMRETQSSLPRVSCPHCNKIGHYATMQRWHFNKCKHNTDGQNQ